MIFTDHAIRSLKAAHNATELINTASALLDSVCPSHLPSTRRDAVRLAVRGLIESYRHSMGDIVEQFELLDDEEIHQLMRLAE